MLITENNSYQTTIILNIIKTTTANGKLHRIEQHAIIFFLKKKFLIIPHYETSSDVLISIIVIKGNYR